MPLKLKISVEGMNISQKIYILDLLKLLQEEVQESFDVAENFKYFFIAYFGCLLCLDLVDYFPLLPQGYH